MIPVLFKEDEQIFSHNGIGALYESLSCDVIEEENGAFTMELEYPVDGEWFSELKDFRIIQAKPNDIDEPHNFRIYEIEKSIDELTVFVRANTRTNDLGNNLITNYVGKNVTPQQAMNGIKSNLIEPTNFDLISDIQTRSSVEWTRVNPLNAIVGVRGSLVDIWGGQLKRTNTAIHLYSRRGRDNVVTIRPGKNIEGLTMTVSTAGLVTKILPIFSYRPVDVPKYQMVTKSDGSKEKRRVSTSGSTNLRDDITVLGDVVSSQYVDNYPTNYWSSVDYGDDDELRDTVDDYISTRLKNAEESSGIVDMSKFDQELKDFVKTELDKRAKQYFTHRNPGVDKPTVRIIVNMLQLSDSPDWEEFKDLERIGLTDTLDVWVDEYDIDVEVRVTSLTYDSIAEEVTNFSAGSDRAPRQSAIEKKYDDLTKATNDYITSFKNGIQNVLRNTADGLNRKFEGYTEPPAELSSEGDIWFKEIGEGKVEIWIHDGVYWQPLMTEDFGKKIEADIEAVQSELDAAKLQAVADSEQALEDAKAYAEAEDARIRGELESDIGGAIELAEQAKTEAVTKANQALEDAKTYADAEIVLIGSHFDSIIEGVESDVADVKQTADDAVYKIDNDIANKFTSLDAEILSIETISNSAQANAQTALDQSQDALGDASTALTNAQTALDRANTAISSASNAATLAGGAVTKADEAMNSASSALTKADEAKDAATILSGQVSGFETTVAGFNQTINNYEGQVSGFRNDILGLESTVANYESEVDEFGNTVSTYATEVSSLTNTVSGFESTVATYGIEVSNLAGEVLGYKNQVSTLNNTVSGLESTVATYATEVDEFGDTVSTYATEVSTMRNTVAGFESTVATYGTEVSDLAGEVVGYKNQVSTFNNTVSGFNSTVANYTTEVNEFGEEVESYVTEVSTLTNTVSGFQSKVTKVEQDYAGISGTVATHTTQISNLNGELALKASTTSVNTLTGRVSTAETGISVNSKAIALKANTTTVNDLTGRVSTAETSITANATAIALKANTTTVNDLTGRVDTAETSITANANDIKLKANTTTVNALTGRVTTAETGITANANAIKLKASQSSVDSLTGRVNSAETSITANANAIGLKANQSSVDTLSGTVNTLSGRVDVTAGQISSKVWNTDIQTAVDDIEVGGRNLILDSRKLTITTGDGSEGTLVFSNIENLIRIEAIADKTRTANFYNTGFANLWTDKDGILEAISNGVEYTLSMEIRYKGASRIRLGFDTRGVSSPIYARTEYVTDTDNKWIKIHAVKKESGRPKQSQSLIIGWFDSFQTGDYVEIRNIKLEKGNKATDWTPAPEDTTDLINHVESELTQKHDSIVASVSSIDGRVATNTLNLDGLTTTVQSVQTDLTGTTTLLNTTRTTVSGHTSTIATLRTDVNGKATTAQFNTLNSTVNGTITRVGNAEGKITTIETSVSGLQTTVASKASQTQVTQLSNLLSSTVEGVEGNTTQISQLTDNINLRVSKGEVLSQINIEAERTLIQSNKLVLDATSVIFTGSAFIPSAQIASIDAAKITAGTISTARLNTSAIVTAGLTANVIKSTHIETSTATVDKIFATDAMVNRLTAKTAFITSVKAVDIDAARITSGTISAARLNASAIVTAGLTANVVKSTHISADTALFDKLFASTLATDRLSAQTAWIKNANIADASITGAKIADATIGSAKIATLDVSKLSGNITNFVQSNWDSIYTSVDISGSSVGMIHSNNVRLNGYAFELSSLEVRIGVPTYIYDDLDMRANDIIFGRDMAISANTNPGQWLHFKQSGSDIMAMGSEIDVYRQLRLNGNSISLGGGQSINSPGNVLRLLANNNLQMSISANSINTYTTIQAGANFAMNLNHIYFSDSSNIYAPLDGQLQINIQGNRRALFRNADISFYNELNMRGYYVTGQSDKRLKTNIHSTSVNSLEAIKEWEFVDYNWIDPELNQETQLGLIAQNTTEISLYNAGDDIWNINTSKQIMINSHAIQQLYFEFDKRVESNESKIHKLQQELSKANRRIEELESVI